MLSLYDDMVIVREQVTCFLGVAGVLEELGVLGIVGLVGVVGVLLDSLG